MAHHCSSCGLKCHCGGDIDDLILGENYSCTHCESDDDFNEDEYYEEQENLNYLNPINLGPFFIIILENLK